MKILGRVHTIIIVTRPLLLVTFFGFVSGEYVVYVRPGELLLNITGVCDIEDLDP